LITVLLGSTGDLELLERALKHYKDRLSSFRQDEDLKKQTQRGSNPLSNELQEEAKRITKIIDEKPHVDEELAPRRQKGAYPDRFGPVFILALQQYKEDLPKIRDHVPLGLRTLIEQEEKLIQPLLDKINRASGTQATQ